MSVYNIKSEVIANRDATPAVFTNPEKSQGYLKAAIGVEDTGGGFGALGAAGSQIRLVSVPSNARIHGLEYATGDHGTSSLDITVFYPTIIPQGGANVPASTSNAAVISSSAFASGIAGVDTSRGWTEGMGVATAPTIPSRPLPLWQLVGLSNDPGIDLDLGFTVRVAVVQNGYVGLKATYVD